MCEGREDVQVAGYVDYEVESLRFEGYSGAGLVFISLMLRLSGYGVGEYTFV
jgi:hypothetical protein